LKGSNHVSIFNPVIFSTTGTATAWLHCPTTASVAGQAVDLCCFDFPQKYQLVTYKNGGFTYALGLDVTLEARE